MGAEFEDDQIVIKPLFKLFFGKKIKIPYEKIERIELPAGDSVLFYMKNGKVIKVSDPGIVAFYTDFGEMLKKYKIPYKCLMEDAGEESIETVRVKAARTREVVLECGNRILQEKMGPEYELDAKIVERIIGVTLELRLLKDGVFKADANGDESIDGEPLADEVDLAILSEWDPAYGQGKYTLIEDETDQAGWEEYLKNVAFFREGE